MARHGRTQYLRQTVRIEPETMEEVERLIMKSGDIKNFSQFTREAILSYIQQLKGHAEEGTSQGRPGRERVIVKLSMPLVVHQKVVWMAEYEKGGIPPRDLMLLLISDGVKDLSLKQITETLEENRKLRAALQSTKEQEDDLLAP
ncbi:MAG: ribbon-helix-helix domain-containing protein [Candidatus Thermoplasmatota archaeon]|nr:ribbon-helix-helix domain-containing protein [Candidatus Thermoplasmatota archaeon]